MHLIKKSFLAALILLVLYEVFLKIVVPDKLALSGQEQVNISKAEKYIYNKSKSYAVIVGSSLSAGLLMDSIPGIVNLSFTGHGLHDGLELVAKKKAQPDIVFIETNKFFRPADSHFINILYHPVLYHVKEKVSFLQAGRQPLAYIGMVLQQPYNIRQTHTLSKSYRRHTIETQKQDNGRIELIKNNIIIYQHPDTLLIKQQIAELKNRVSLLTRKGIKIVFFEMPVNPILYNLAESNLVRKTINYAFPSSKFRYLPSPDCHYYSTSDGMHLNAQDKLRYTLYFKAQIKKLGLMSSNINTPTSLE